MLPFYILCLTLKKVYIITKLQKLDSLPRNLRAGNKSPVLILKKRSSTGDLSHAHKIFIERPEYIKDKSVPPFKQSNLLNIVSPCCEIKLQLLELIQSYM